jgi:hypothetical protein
VVTRERAGHTSLAGVRVIDWIDQALLHNYLDDGATCKALAPRSCRWFRGLGVVRAVEFLARHCEPYVSRYTESTEPTTCAA